MKSALAWVSLFLQTQPALNGRRVSDLFYTTNVTEKKRYEAAIRFFIRRLIRQEQFSRVILLTAMLLHTVRQGECLSSIAAYYGFSDWRLIYDDPANAQFKQKRPNPNLIYPNDELYIPDRNPSAVGRPTNARHFFVVKRRPTFINVRVQNLAKEPIKNARYKLVLEDTELEGTTDENGCIKTEIHASDEYGTLIVWPDANDAEEKTEWRVHLGHLDPLETVTGVKGRLRNLNYYHGEIDDKEDEVYEAAVRRFQEDYDLVIDGIVGQATRARLKQQHRV
jgi:hypothetical protein